MECDRLAEEFDTIFWMRLIKQYRNIEQRRILCREWREYIDLAHS